MLLLSDSRHASIGLFLNREAIQGFSAIGSSIPFLAGIWFVATPKLHKALGLFCTSWVYPKIQQKEGMISSKQGGIDET
jgi:hypothetical protein